ncbi:hypothetical protein N9K02_00585 [Gammaproteobacteria bacterium]|nr:hypothetical protein [Gammaproteobacteria bacterium]
MKKLLALLLLSPLVSGEDTEYPIELTCVGGIQIVYIHLTKKQEGSWFKLVNANLAFLPSANKKINNTKIELKKYKINKDLIIFKKYIGTGLLRVRNVFQINRKTGEGIMGSTGNTGQGFVARCSRGITEFNENII